MVLDQPFFTLFVTSAAVSAVTAAASWRHRRRTPAAGALAVTLAALAWWAAVDAVGRTAVAEQVQLLAAALAFPAICAVPIGFYALCRYLVDPHWQPSTRLRLLLLVEPAVAFLAALTNASHHLLFADVWAAGDPLIQHVRPGPLFWLHSGYSYVLVVAGLVRLVLARRRATRVFRRQIDAVLASAGAGVLVNVGVLVSVGTARTAEGSTDHSPLSFVLTCLIDAWALTRLGLLQLVPVAREQVMDTVEDAVAVVDVEGRLLDVNPAARSLLRRLRVDLPDDPVGLPLEAVAGSALSRLDRTRGEQVLLEPLPGLFLDVRATPLDDRHGRPLGAVLVARDVTADRAARQALERANEQLLEQLVTIERLREQLAEEAVRDPLTGLHNRRHLERSLDSSACRARETGEPMSVLLLDVDHFKDVNDRYGHQAGDEVLCALARQLLAGTRTQDTVARFGGEEFVVVLPGADAAQGWERAEQLRERCTRLALHAPALPTSVTLSIGVATWDGEQDVADLLAAADRALYQAKETGRNRVVAAV